MLVVVLRNLKEVSVLKARVKFEKLDSMKFVGHLDMMRYFQKAIRRAGIDIAYSGGFSPHMIMSFASPLGVGVTSSAEYFDIELQSAMNSEEMVKRFNSVMANGCRVLSVREIPDAKSSKGMSLVAATDYYIDFRDDLAPKGDWKNALEGFFNQEQIIVHKKTKRSEADVDIKPFIYKLSSVEGKIFIQVASGSANNLKPEPVVEAIYRFLGEEMPPFALMVHRQEVYADIGKEGVRELVTLESLGEEIE